MEIDPIFIPLKIEPIRQSERYPVKSNKKQLLHRTNGLLRIFAPLIALKNDA